MMSKTSHSRRSIGLALAVPALCALAAGCAGTRGHAVQPPDVVADFREPPAPVSVEGYVTERGVYHVVQPGQTMWRIANAYGVPLDDLARINGIGDTSILQSGSSLFIPGAGALLDVPPYPAPPTRTAVENRPRVGASADTAFDWPIPDGRVVSGYGANRRTHRHQGVDISSADGHQVLAARAGRVVYSGATLRGYGKTVIIDHGDRVRSLYAHNSSLLVREGDWVERGQAIARIGRTGNASGEHCHFEIRKNEIPVNPLGYLPTQESSER